MNDHTKNKKIKIIILITIPQHLQIKALTYEMLSSPIIDLVKFEAED